MIQIKNKMVSVNSRFESFKSSLNGFLLEMSIFGAVEITSCLYTKTNYCFFQSVAASTVQLDFKE